MLHQKGGFSVPLICLFTKNLRNSRPWMARFCTELDLMIAIEGIYVSFKRVSSKHGKTATSNAIAHKLKSC